jgi:hypothetical protein
LSEYFPLLTEEGKRRGGGGLAAKRKSRREDGLLYVKIFSFKKSFVIPANAGIQ